jgi:hypothetical protein
MRKKRIAMLVVTAAALLLLSPNQTIDAMPEYETVYTVWYNHDMVPCMIGPPHPPSIEGEWIDACNGGWYGWGWEPDDPCAYTVVSQGESCSGGGGGGP